MNTWNRGLAWRDGKLYVFEPTSILVMRLWPEMRAWRRTRSRPWSPTRSWADRALCGGGDIGTITLLRNFLRGWVEHKGRFVGPLCEVIRKNQHYQALSYYVPDLTGLEWLPYIQERNSDTLAVALATIPLREQQIAGRLNERRWHALALMARCPGAADLLESNPALGFALASNWVFHKPAVSQPMRAARALIRKKQLAILDWLGFPPTDRIRKILVRIPPAALGARSLLHLRWALEDRDTQALLAHLPVVTADILRFVSFSETRKRLAPCFLHELSSMSAFKSRGNELDSEFEYPQHFNLWMDAKSMARDLGRQLPITLHSLAQLRRWHDDLAAELNDANRTNAKYIRTVIAQADFGYPPLPGTDNIVPLCSGQELLDEGSEMEHCVVSYWNQVLEGSYFVYRVKVPRATLGLRRSAAGWHIDQVKGPNNRRIGRGGIESISAQLFVAQGAHLYAEKTSSV